MKLFEQAATQLRHLPGLRSAERLWGLLRPCYDLVLRWMSPHGLQRLMNGTDDIRLLPELRVVREEYEPEVWRIVMAALKTGSCVVEAGAHIGLYAVAMAKRVGPSGRILAAEPDAAGLAILRRMIELNDVEPQVTVVPAALSDQPGQAVLHEQGIQSRLHAAGAAEEGPTVSVTTIDAMTGGCAVDLILVDVEGFELPVLRGASALLRTPSLRPRTIVIEVHPYAWEASSTTSEALLGWLTQHGYDVTDPQGRPVNQIRDYGHIIGRLP